MEYPIYAFGGGEQLISVFNAVGMIFKSDSTYLTPVGKMAMQLGGVYIGIKAIFKGDIGLLIKGWVIPSMIVFLILYSPKTTVWFKDEVAMNAPVKIDNIPFGVSFFTSLSSSVTQHLSKQIDETMLPVGVLGASKTGVMFGAKAVAKLRDVQLQDPILLQNTKEYMRQCYMMPYVIGNFGNLKGDAIKSTDILDFLDKNPAKGFGIKPVGIGGSLGKFMTCSEAGKMIKAAVEAESRDPLLLNKLGASLGLTTSNNALLNQRIKSMVSDTLTFFDQRQTDVHEWMKQAMILNANREALDDYKEKYGLSRAFPELVRMQATRGVFQQSLGSIVGAEMAESMIPAAVQPVMLSLIVMVFVIILPFAVLPGGWQYTVTGFKLQIWVSSWPLFYSIIHAISMIQIREAIGEWGVGGLSLIGQGGFTEIILQRYATSQSLITSVPVISYAVVFGSSHVISSIASAIGSVVSSTSIGANMADGNISFGQRSYDNLTRGQENYAPSLLMGGGVIDDGMMRVQSDSNGNQIITEHQDNMSRNYNAQESMSSSTSTSLGNSKSLMASISDRESQVSSLVNAQNLDVARSIARGTTQASNLSISEVNALKMGFGMDQSTNKGTTSSDNKSTGTNAHLDLKVPRAVSAITGFGGGTSTTAANSHDVREDMSVQERQAFNGALDKVKSAAKADSLTTNNSDDMRLNKSFSSNLSKQEQIGHEKAKTQQDIDSLTKQLSWIESNSGTINRNANDQVIKEVMNQHPELRSKEQAARWMRTHSEEADAIARPIISNFNPFDSAQNRSEAQSIERSAPNAKTMTINSADGLEQNYKEQSQKVQDQAVVTDGTKQPESLEKVVTKAANTSNSWYNNDTNAMLGQHLNSEEKRVVGKLENEMKRGEKSASKLVNEKMTEEKAKSENISHKSTVARVLEDIGDTSTAVIDAADNLITGNSNKDKK